jgi:hypothetical protein
LPIQIIYDPSVAKPIIGMIPPGGWHYYDGDAKLIAYSYEDLVKTVESFRAENHLPVGDVEGDIASYICGNWSHFCHGVDSVVVTSVNAPTRQSELLDDIQTWAKNLMHSKKRHNYVTDELAEQRAKVCLSCPKNFNWKSGCLSCISATQRLSASVRQGRDTKSSPKLGGCLSQRHDNRSAIFLDRDEFTKASGLPDGCWLNI